MKKGFSLFTPLVGTAVVIITIVITVVMVQNDVRISRGLIDSYESSAQATSSRLITAAAEVQIIDNIENTVESYIGGKFGTPTVVCGDNKPQCISSMKSIFTSNTGTLESQMTRGGSGIYSGVINNIETVTNYETIPKPCNIDTSCNNEADTYSCCVSKALRLTSSAIDIGWEDNKIRVNVDPNSLSNYANVFSVSFQNKDDSNDKITLSILPYGLTFKTEERIEDFIEKSAEAYVNTIGGECPPANDIGAKEVRKIVETDNVKVEVDWKTTGGTLTLAFQKKSASPTALSEIC